MRILGMMLGKNKEILIVLFASIILNAVGIWYGLPSYEGWAPDEILPRYVQAGITQHFSNGWHQKYPPLHYYLLALMEAPIMLYSRLQGLDWRSLEIYSSLIFAGRLLSLFMAVGIVLLVYRCGLEILSQRASLFAAGIAALIVPFVYYAKTANLDVPYLFWFMNSLFFFLRLLKTRQRKYYLLFALTGTLAVCAKDQAYGLYVLPPLIVLLSDWKRKKKEVQGLSVFRFLANPTYLLATTVAFITFFLVYNLAFNYQGFIQHIKLITGPVSKNYRLVSHTLSGHLLLLERAWDQIRFSLGWPLFCVCLAGVIMSLVRQKKNSFLLSLFSFVVPYEILYIHVILFNYSRYYLPLLLVLSLFGGQFIADVLAVRSRLSLISRLTVAAIFSYSLLYAFSLNVLMIKDSRYAAEKWMRQNIPRDALVGLAVWKVYAPRVEGYRWVSLTHMSLEKFRALSQRPDFIIVNTEFRRRFRPGTAEHRFFKGFSRGKESYEIVFRHRSSFPWLPIRPREVLKQINTINPEIVIYRKVPQSEQQAIRERALTPSS